ncbi:MAG: acyl-CoA dehydrogenase family protein [Gordonia sp. (in: high G+C Gram-positive bacteria)]
MAACRRFAEESLKPGFAQYDRENRFADELYEQATAQGLTNVVVPLEAGGLGLPMRALIDGGLVMSRVCAPITFSIFFNNGALRPILLGGTSELKTSVAEFLGAGKRVSLCLTEESSGTDLLALGTRAEYTAGQWLISGRKAMVGNGTHAHLYVTLADAVVNGRSQGPTFFAIPRESAGLSVSENTDKLGFRAVPTPTVTFDRVSVDDAQVIGPVGNGLPLLFNTLQFMRVGGGVVMLGITEGATDDAMEWVTTRKIRNGVLSDASHIQIALGKLIARSTAVDTLIRHAASLLEDGLPCERQSASAKLTAAELSVDATAAVVQMHGWRGIDNSFPIQKRYRDARQTTIFEGTTELQAINLFHRHRKRYLAEVAAI